MTISTTAMRADFAGNGVTTIFAMPAGFRVFADSELRVVKRTDATGAEVLLVLNTDYTVSGAGAYASVSVTCTVAPATGTTLLVDRVIPLLQATDIRNQGSFFAKTHEDVFDRLTMLLQGIAPWQKGRLAIAAGANFVNVAFTSPAPSAFYTLDYAPNWNTSIYWSAKTVNGFTLTFSNPAPGGGGLLDWRADV